MSTRTSTRIAWSLWSISIVSMAIGVLLFVTSGSTAARGFGGQPLMDLTFVMFATMGALIVSRHPENAIGWLFSLIGLTSALGQSGLGYGYVHYALFGHPGSLPGGVDHGLGQRLQPRDGSTGVPAVSDRAPPIPALGAG